MTCHHIIRSRGQRWLFGGLLLAIVGISLICVSGEGSLNTLAHLSRVLVLAGVLIWLCGAIIREGELLNGRD